MNPSCKCDDVILHFVENDEREHNNGADFVVSLSLKNKKFEILDADGISKKQVEEIVENSLKESDEAIKLLKQRYKEMKATGRKVLQGINPNNKIVEPVQVKPERNSPCPCGSGKKYKKCCGA